MNNEKKNVINIVAQAFYGNRTVTEVNKENIDRFILGYLDNDIPVSEPIDRGIVHIPNTDGIVLVYNKHKEESSKKDNVKPLAVVSEENIELYSRCIACRMNAEGELESLQNDDYGKLINYLAE